MKGAIAYMDGHSKRESIMKTIDSQRMNKRMRKSVEISKLHGHI